ncbi:MAG: hypothetical protein HY319_03150 [Armatimonadetes bacterium]|nr:hypothetical protein [Armatimonadota bacterium]
MIFLMAAPALSLPPEGDNWARATLSLFAERGLLDRTRQRSFLGASSASRWEIARDVGRLLGDVRQSHGQLVTAEELEKLERLVAAYSSELSQMGIDADFAPARPALDERALVLPGLRMSAPAGLSLPEIALDNEIQRLRSEFQLQPDLHLQTGFLDTHSLTESNLANLGRLDLGAANLELGWDLNPDWTLRGGLDLAFERSMLPGLEAARSDFDQITSSISAPYLGVDRKLTESTAINLDIRYFSAREDFSSRSLESVELPEFPGVSSDSWEVNTRFVVRF